MKRCIFLLLQIIPVFVFSQKNIKSATITTVTNQVIEGVINDKEWFNNPSSFSFKANGNNTFSTYNVADVLSVKITDGNYYVSKTVEIDVTPNRTFDDNAQLDSSNFSFKTATVFLTAKLLSDKINLYTYVDSKLHLFVQTPNSPIKELIHRKFKVNKNNALYEDEDNSYISQLSKLLQDCPTVEQQLENITFRETQVIKLLQNYLTCKNETPSFLKIPQKGNLTVGLLLGTSISSVVFSQKDAQASGQLIYDDPFKGNIAPTAGIRLKYTIPGKREKISLLGDIYYTNFKGSKEKQVLYISPTFYTQRKIAIDFSMIAFRLQFRYSFATNTPLKPFINTGINFAKPFGDKSNVIDTEIFNGSTSSSSTTQLFPYGLRSIIPSLTGGAGVAYNKLSFEYSLYYVNRITDSKFYASKYVAHQLTLCYFF